MKSYSIYWILLLGCLLLSSGVALGAEACDCDHILTLDSFKINGNTDNVQPGDVICLEAGTRGSLRLEYLQGTADKPIIVKNCGGQLTIESGGQFALAGSQHIHITGTGDPSHFYGIRSGGTVYIGGLSSDVEIDHVEVYDAGFAGFMIKTDPGCDSRTWRENFVMENISVHDNYAHGMDDGEGFYVGYTFFDGRTITCDGVETTVYAHLIPELEFYNNITNDTGSEGIQIGSAPNALVYNNKITQYGQRPFAQYQNNGMQIGAGTTGKVYNNWIENGPGTGLIVLATGELVFYNNLIKDIGGIGIFCDERSTASTVSGFDFINNTIVDTVDDGIRIYADLVPLSHIKNNIIANVGGEFVKKLNDNVTLDMTDNLFADTTAEVGFVAPNNNDYRLQVTSSAVDSGTDVSGFGVGADRYGTARPYDGLYDLGAFEFLPTLRLSGTGDDQTINLSWSFDSTLPNDATWRITYERTGEPAAVVSGLAKEIDAYQITGLTNYEFYTVTLEARQGSTTLYSDTTTVMPTDQKVYLPAVIR